MSKVLIVHADDFNLTRGVNEGIVQAFRQGAVRSTSVMANLAGLPGAVSALRAAAGLDVGLHFNLTMGRPVLRPEEIPSLVRETGEFRKRTELHSEVLSLSEVRKELVAQIGAIMKLGLLISHIDTHHHIHEDERVFTVLMEVARTMNLALRCYNIDMYRILQAEGIRSPQHLITRFYGEDVTAENLKLILAMLPDGVTELCCHPAQVDDELRSISSYHEPRARELELLSAPETLAYIQSEGIRLAGYADAFSAASTPA